MSEQAEVGRLVDDLFAKVQRAQGRAFCSDGETFPTKAQLFERIRGRLKWNNEASRIMRAWLREHDPGSAS